MAKRTQHTIGLDIGTSRVTCIAGEPGEGGLLDVVGIGELVETVIKLLGLIQLVLCDLELRRQGVDLLFHFRQLLELPRKDAWVEHNLGCYRRRHQEGCD